MNTKNKKGFFSVCLLLFVSLFLSIVVSNRRDNYYSLLSVKLLDTKKQSATINFEEFVKTELKAGSNDPIVLNKTINQKLSNYLNSEENEKWFILDNKTNQRKEISYTELLKISKTIVLKPAPNITLKRYTLTNGITKTQQLSFELSTNCSKTVFSFPKNYSVEVIIYE